MAFLFKGLEQPNEIFYDGEFFSNALQNTFVLSL